MSFIFKGFERIIYWRLLQTALHETPLSPRQHAFRKGFSTETAVSSLVNLLEQAGLRQKAAVVVSLDIKGAFDHIIFDSAERVMRRRGFDPGIIAWYIRFLKTRICTVRIKGVIIRRFLRRGVPQGGILSPLIWNIIFDELLEEMERKTKVRSQAFADDMILFTTGKNLPRLVSYVQSALTTAATWCAQNGLSLSPSKTMACILTRAKSIADIPNITLGTNEIAYVDQFKYLGLIIDSELTFRPHIKAKIAKAKGILMRSKSLLGNTFGPSPKLMLWMYKAIVRSTLCYLSFIWGQTTQAYFHTQLERLQSLGLRLLGHFRRGTPNEGLNVITDTPPSPSTFWGKLSRPTFASGGR
jgi:hypothetical protein